MNHKLIYVLLLVFIFSAQKIKAMNGDNQIAKPILFNVQNVLKGQKPYSKDNKLMIITACNSIDTLLVSEKIKVLKKDKSNTCYGIVRMNDANKIEKAEFEYDHIMVLQSWKDYYQKDNDTLEMVKKAVMPASKTWLLLKGCAVTTILGGAFGILCWKYPQKKLMLGGLGLLNFTGIYFWGIDPLICAWNYKEYKEIQEQGVKQYQTRIDHEVSPHLKPLTEVFRKIDNALKDDKKNVIVTQKELDEI